MSATSTASNITASVNGTEADAAYSGTATGTGAFTQNTTAGNALSMANSSGTNTRYWTLTLGGSDLNKYINYKVYFQSEHSTTGATVITISYSTDGTTFTALSNTVAPGLNTTFTEAYVDLSGASTLNNQTAVYIRFAASGASATGTLRIDNLEIQAATSPWTMSGGNVNFTGGLTATSFTTTGDARVTGALTSGAATVSSLSNSGNLNVAGTTTLSGAVTTGALTSGATTVSSLTSTGGISAPSFTVSGNSNLGSLTSGSVTISSLAGGTGLTELYVDASGNLSRGIGGGGQQLSCATNSFNWNIGGNNIANFIGFANPPAIGTCDAFDLVFKAGNNRYMWLKTTGQLGIGVNNSTPSAQLDVIAPNGQTAFRLGNSASNFITVDGNGKVGIGTPSPIGVLSIISSASSTPGLFIANSADKGLFIVNSDGSTEISDADPNNSNGLLFLTHSNGSTLSFLGNGTGDIISSSALTPYFASGHDFSIFEGVPGTGILRFKIDGSNGNIGIGTPTPLGVLDIRSTTSSVPSLFISNSTDQGLFVVNSDGSTQITDGNPNDPNPILYLSHSNGSSLQFLANGVGDIASSAAFRPHFASGDFSVFEGTPGSGNLRLQINSAATGGAGNGTIVLRSLDPTSTNDAITIRNNNLANGSGTETSLFQIKNDGSTIINSSSSSTAPFTINNAGNKIFQVDNNGYIHSGATYPRSAPYSSARISVDGMFVAKELWVVDQTTGGWADYVFKKEYKLMPLNEVEKYVNENHHLPNIPSANEVEEKGQNVGSLQVKQMEKIEEHTLYLIEMKKEINEIKEENKALKKELAELKKK